MKKLFLLLSIVCLTAFAEASFDQIEGLIEKQQYAAAEAGLEGIIKNHPNSAKAYYAMAQAQAGLGNQEKARFALNKARGIDPELSFVGRSSVEKLEMAITPQVKNIEPVTEGHFWRNLFIFFALVGICYWAWNKYWRDDEGDKAVTPEPKPTPPDSPSDRAYMSERNMAPKEPAKPTAQVGNPAPAAPVQPAVAAPVYYAPAPTQTVIHHTSSNDGLLTGMVLGQMLGDHHHHHETTRVVEREVVREVPAAPAPTRDSSWDDNSSSSSSSWFSSTPSKSSSWDSDSSSSSSSSWGSSSSSSSDSSWSGSSDSSSSSSDSSWD